MTAMSRFLRVAFALGVSFVALAQFRTISRGTARKLVQEALVAMGENGQTFRSVRGSTTGRRNSTRFRHHGQAPRAATE